MLRLNTKQYLIIFFILCCLIYRYLYFNLLGEFNFFEYILIDNIKANNYGIDFLDDSFKYESLLIEVSDFYNFLYFHGGKGLDLIIKLPSIFGFEGAFLSRFFVISNILMIIYVWNSLSRINSKVHFFLIPYLATLTITVNKEIYTIFFLFLISPNFINLNFNIFKSTFFGKVNKILFVYLAFISTLATFLSRPYLCFFCFGFYLIFYLCKRKRFFLIKKNLLLLPIIFLVIFLIIALINASIEEGNRVYNINDWFNRGRLNIFSLRRILITFYSLTAPFPNAIINVKKLFSGNPILIYNYLSYLAMSILGVLRIFYFSKLFKLKNGFSKNPIYYEYLFLLLSLVLIIGFRGQEITRQLLTISIPLTYYLSYLVSFKSLKNN